MNYNKTLAISVLTVIIVAFLFISGNSILTKSFLSIPAGNLILWLGLIALQITNYSINKGFESANSFLSNTIKLLSIGLLLLSILWFGIAYFISGDLGFNFNSNATSFAGSPEAGVLHWRIIYSLVISPVVLIIIYKIGSFIENRKHKTS
ncbi:MAG: hypothetical protein Wins2KO_25100 [Winogradskyella sp.]